MVRFNIFNKIRLLFALGALGFFIPIAKSAQWAQVVSTKAEIYADKQLLVPIGFVRQGKKIRIGEVVRKYGTVYPIFVSGKIAYIQTKDIHLEKELLKDKKEDSKSDLEHKVINEVTTQVEDNFSQNNHISIMAGQGTSSGDWKTLSDSIDQSHPTTETIKLTFEHRPQFHRTSWAFGLGYDRSSGSKAQLVASYFDFNFYWAFLKTGLINLELAGGILLYPQFNIKTEGETEGKDGSGWGYNIGGRGVLFPHSFISLFGELKMTNTNYTNFENIALTSSTSSATVTVKKSQTISIIAGISFSI